MGSPPPQRPPPPISPLLILGGAAEAGEPLARRPAGRPDAVFAVTFFFSTFFWPNSLHSRSWKIAVARHDLTPASSGTVLFRLFGAAPTPVQPRAPGVIKPMPDEERRPTRGGEINPNPPTAGSFLGITCHPGSGTAWGLSPKTLAAGRGQRAGRLCPPPHAGGEVAAASPQTPLRP